MKFAVSKSLANPGAQTMNDGMVAAKSGLAHFWMPNRLLVPPGADLVTTFQPPCPMSILRFLSESRSKTWEITSIQCGHWEQLVPGTPPLPLDMFGLATDASLMLDTVAAHQNFTIKSKNISDEPAEFRLRVWATVTDIVSFRKCIENMGLDHV